MSERTWEISDLDGSNKRTVTLAEFLAYSKEKAAEAMAIHRANVAKIERR